MLDAPPAGADRDAARVRAVSNVLDRFFVDPVLGLIAPGLGDVVSAVFGLYVVALAVRRGRPPVIVARMLLNLAGDALLGAVPLVGDVFDFGFKAHRANAQLFLGERGRRYHTTWRDWMVVVGAGLVLLTTLAVTILALGAVLRWLFGLI
jgi:hypothetical protein